MPKANKAEKVKKGKGKKEARLHEPPKVGKPEKAKREPKLNKVAPGAGITGVELVTLSEGSPASCTFDAATGHLTLRLPKALDGRPGEPGAPGLRGLQGEAGKNVDYTRAPGGEEDFYLYVDEEGRLSYYAKGRIARVHLDDPEPAVYEGAEI